MTKPTVTDAMVEAALIKWHDQDIGSHNQSDFMQAAITAAIEASGLVERIAELEAEKYAQRVAIEMLKEGISDAGLRLKFVPRHPQALNKEPTP